MCNIVAENLLYSGVTGKKHPVDDTTTADLGEHIYDPNNYIAYNCTYC